MSETRICPNCGMGNPLGRVTCQICHKPIMKKDSKQSESKDEKGQYLDSTPETQVQDIIPPEVKPIRKPRMDKENKEKLSPPQKVKKVIKRRRHKAPVTPADQVVFLLDNGKLRAANIKLFISKPIKTKELPPLYKKYIAFINRNTELLSG